MAEVEKTLADEAKAKAENLDIPVEEPTSEFIVQNKEAATRAIKMADLEESSIKKNKDGTFTVSVKAPDQASQVQDFDAPAGQVIQQVSKVFDLGRAVKDRKIRFMDTNKVVKGKNPLAQANITEVVKLGAMLSGNKIDYTKNLAKQVRNNLMEGLAYLTDKGYELETRKGDKLGLPGSTVVFGSGITLNNLKAVSTEIQELSHQLDTLENTSPREELFEAGNEDALSNYYENKREATRSLSRALSKYGIEDKPTTFSPDDIIDEAGVVEGHKPNTFAALTPEYVGQGTRQRASKAGPDNKVEAYTVSITPKEVNYAVDLLKHLGIKTNINFVDEQNIPFIIAGLTEQINSDPKNAETYQTKIAALENILIDQPKGRIEYFDKFPNVLDRVPTIFISNKVKGQERVRAITHELGHLVQRVSLDQAPKETQDAFREAAGEMTPNAFQEWFANQLLTWVGNRAVPKGMISKFFKELAQQLKKLFDYITKNQTLNETYAEFMDAMVSAEGQRDHKPSRMKTRIGRQFETEILDFPSAGPFLLRSGMQQSADFTPMTPALSNLLKGMKVNAKKAFSKFNSTKVGSEITDNLEGTGETILALHDAVIRSADNKLRAMKNDTVNWIANNWKLRSGDKRESGHADIPTEIRQRGARFHTRIEQISRHWMPRTKNKVVDTVFGMEHGRLDKSSQVYNAIGEILVSEKLPDIKNLENEYGKDMANDIVAGYSATRKYLDDLYDYLTNDLGLAIKRRKNYFPHALDVAAVTSSKEEFMAILKAEGIGKNNPQGKTQDQALEDFYRSLVASEGTLMDMNLEDQGDILSPSFSAAHKRVFGPEIAAKLQKFYIKDPMSVLTTYTHSAMKRGVIQKRFNPTGVISRNKLTGANTIDPMHELNEKLTKAEEDYSAGLESGLSPEQIKKVRKVIDAYLGRIGSDMNPKLRNMSALMVTYHNMRLLSFVVLSSVVDAGFIDSRSGSPFASMRELFKVMADKGHRAELYASADMIGAIRDDITEHIVNDQASMTYMSHKMKAGNEAFFKLVRMHQWTNLSRVMALSAGKTALLKHANSKSAKSAKFLDILGVSREEILGWKGDLSDIPPNINTALNQFIDESVIRPDAAIRPVWGSDPNFAVFFHLKQFMWAYHEIILRRVWAETKSAEGLMKAVPIMLLGMATLPLAAAGYELRRWIGYLGEVPEWSEKQGGDYFWEVVQRSGAPGILQLYVDADETSEHGQFAPIALLGPTFRK